MSWSKAIGATLLLACLSPLASGQGNQQDKALDEIKKEIAELRKQNAELQQRIKGLESPAVKASTGDLEKELRNLNSRYLSETRSSSWANFQKDMGIDLTLTGEIRGRGEYYDHTDGTADMRWLQRLRLNMDIKVSDYLSVFAQLQDSRPWGDDALTDEVKTNATTTTPSDSGPEFHQAYMTMKDVFGTGNTVMVGRQEVVLGDERHFGDADWNNVGQVHEGIVMTGELFDGVDSTLWAVLSQNDFGDLNADEHRLYGGWFSVPMDDILNLDLWTVFSNNAQSDLDAWYLGARATGALEFVSYAAEYATLQSAPDSAGVPAASSDMQLEFEKSYMAAAGVDIGLGDAIEGDPVLHFNYDMGTDEWVELFPDHHGRFGWSNIFQTQTNLVHTSAGFDIGVYDDWRLNGAWHWNRAHAQAGSDDLGQELNVWLEGQCTEHINMIIAFGKHFGGDGFSTFGAAAPWNTVTAARTKHDSTFGYLQITVPF